MKKIEELETRLETTSKQPIKELESTSQELNPSTYHRT